MEKKIKDASNFQSIKVGKAILMAEDWPYGTPSLDYGENKIVIYGGIFGDTVIDNSPDIIVCKLIKDAGWDIYNGWIINSRVKSIIHQITEAIGASIFYNEFEIKYLISEKTRLAIEEMAIKKVETEIKMLEQKIVTWYC